jgi:hypothetical protein
MNALYIFQPQVFERLLHTTFNLPERSCAHTKGTPYDPIYKFLSQDFSRACVDDM